MLDVNSRGPGSSVLHQYRESEGTNQISNGRCCDYEEVSFIGSTTLCLIHYVVPVCEIVS